LLRANRTGRGKGTLALLARRLGFFAKSRTRWTRCKGARHKKQRDMPGSEIRLWAAHENNITIKDPNKDDRPAGKLLFEAADIFRNSSEIDRSSFKIDLRIFIQSHH